jgi:hypothetical protein
LQKPNICPVLPYAKDSPIKIFGFTDLKRRHRIAYANRRKK